MTTVVHEAVRAPRALISERRLLIVILVICLLGIADAGYLTYVHYSGIKVACLASGGGCEKVQASQWSKLDGLPVSLLGLVGYVTILGSLLVRGEPGRAIGFGVALTGFGFSLYLTYRELFTIHAICQWCVGSALMMTALATLTATRFLRSQ